MRVPDGAADYAPLVSAPTDVDPAPATVAGAGSRRLVALVAATVVLTALVQAFVLQTVVVSRDDLDPLVEPGDRVLVWKASPDPRPGDLVVLDTTGTAEVDRSTRVDDGPLGRVLTSVAGLFGIDIGMQHRLAVVGSTDGDRVEVTSPVVASVDREDLVGTGVLRVWPLSRFGSLERDAR